MRMQRPQNKKLNTLLVVTFILTFWGCFEKKERNLVQLTPDYYREELQGYSSGDTLSNQVFLYYKQDSLFLKEFLNYGVAIRDIEVYNSELFKDFASPSKLSTLGFELFHCNCGNCHRYFKTSANDTFKFKIVSLKSKNRLNDFIHKEKNFESDLHLFHPSNYHLDSLEIGLIYDYITNLNNEVVENLK